MIEYSMMLRRYAGSSRPDVCVFRDEDREKAVREMGRYVDKYGFSVQDHDGRYTIADVTLLAKEPVAGAPVISETPYICIYDENGRRRPERQIGGA